MLALLLCVVIQSCKEQPSELSYTAYCKYMVSPQAGLLQRKIVAGFEIKCQYVPPEYLAYNQSSLVGHPQLFDSLLASYRNQQTFFLTISKQKPVSSSTDLLLSESRNYSEYRQKVDEANFRMKDNIEKSIDSVRLKPLEAVLEGGTGLSSERKFILVFDNTLAQHTDESIVWNDIIFMTGIHRFSFQRDVFKSLPRLRSGGA